MSTDTLDSDLSGAVFDHECGILSWHPDSRIGHLHHTSQWNGLGDYLWIGYHDGKYQSWTLIELRSDSKYAAFLEN